MTNIFLSTSFTRIIFLISGDLKLSKTLNYEDKRQYIFPVTATIIRDVTLTAFTSIVINVLNRNDNTPTFLSATIDVSESQLIGSVVYTVEAKDADGDRINYEILSGAEGKFNIGANGRITLIGSLDYDVKNTYSLLVKAYDTVNSMNGTINIRVIAGQKPPPKFTKALYRVSISEAISVGQSVLQLSVLHTIAPTRYKIEEQSGRSFFNIDGGGLVTTAAMMNYEAERQHVFTVTVTDKRNSGSAAIIINVQNVNDMCPIVSPASQTVQITDPVMTNAIVAVIRVRDADSTDITFSLTGGSGLFKIDQHGSIRTTSTIDIKTSISYQLKVSASDGKCTKTANVFVSVSPQAACPNCNAYSFASTHYKTSVQENTVPVTPLLTVVTGTPNTSYSIADANARLYIKVDNRTGMYTVSLGILLNH